MILFTAITIGFLTFFYFKQTSQDFHKNRLQRKEKSILYAIDYAITDYPEEVTPQNIAAVLKPKIYEFSDINNIHISLYDLQGNLELTSEAKISDDRKKVPQQIMEILSPTDDRVELKKTIDNETSINTFTYVYNIRREPIAIVSLPYLHDQSYQQEEFLTLMERFIGVVFIVSLLGGLLSFGLSKSITNRLKKIANRLDATHVVGHNKPIFYNGNDEVKVLVNAYNDMVLKLNEQSELLLKIEREETWREAARQVAHELKNPLTPMRLQIQNFRRRFDPSSPDIKEKVNDLSDGLIRQIDTIANIAKAFSDFTKMPLRKDEKIDIEEELDVILDVFDEDAVHYISEVKGPLYIYFDPNYLVRVTTNLVKNALQAIPIGRKPQIEVRLATDNKVVQLLVKDNGTGIPDELIDKLFQPKFTTKSSGSGLGLPMVKKIIEQYDGSIRFKNNIETGATFIVSIPINTTHHGENI